MRLNRLFIIINVLVLSLTYLCSPSLITYVNATENISINSSNIAFVKDVLRKNFRNFSTSFDLTDYRLTISSQQFANIWYEVLQEKEFFYVISDIAGFETNGIVNQVNVSYVINKSQLEQGKKEVYKRIKELTKDCKKDWNDLQKIIYLHDKLVLCTTYSVKSRKEATPYSLLVKGSANCSGYTRTYSILLNEFGIESKIAFTDNHSWNIVKLNGKWYNVDCTYDDGYSTTPDIHSERLVAHKYFLKSDFALLSHSSTYVNKGIATSKKFDTMKWDDVTSPFVCYSSKIFYFDYKTASLYSYNEKTNKTEKVLTIKDIWYDYDNKRMIWSGNHSSIAFYKNQIYYNLHDSVYVYDIKNGKSMLKMEDLGNKYGYLYGISIEENTLYGYYAHNPNQEIKKIKLKIYGSF